MIAALSTVCTQGLWTLVDPQALSILAVCSWTDHDNSGHSSRLRQELEKLCAQQKSTLSQLTGLAGVSGPGAFTGLRMSASFLKGLSLGLNCPLYALPTYTLFQREIFLPLRHLKAFQLNRESYLKAGFECLKLKGVGEGEIAIPKETDEVLGFDNLRVWPQPENVLQGVKWALKNPGPFKIDYGTDVKISGVRTSLLTSS